MQAVCSADGDNSKLRFIVDEGKSLTSIVLDIIKDGEGGCDVLLFCINALADSMNGINKNTKTRFK